MVSHFLECNHTGRDKYLQCVCMGRIHAWELQASSSPFKPPKGFERPWHQSPDPPWLWFILFFFLSIGQCLQESFALYSNMSLTRQEAVLISMRCAYHLSPGILIYTAVKNLAPNVFYFEPLRRGCSKGLTVLVSLLHSGGACVEEGHWKENPPKSGMTGFNPVSPGSHCWNDSAG